MRLTLILTIGLLAAAPALADGGQGKGATPGSRPGCVAVPTAGTEARDASPGIPARRATLVCAAAPEQVCGGPASSSWRFRANGQPLPDWRAGCAFRT